MKVLFLLLALMMGGDVYAANTAILQSSDGNAITAANPLQVTIAGGGLSVAGGWTSETGRVRTTTLTDNVGIGTSAPTAELTISSTAANNLFLVEDNGPADATSFVIDSGGNVGIGTLVPGAALYVKGNQTVGGVFGIGADPVASGANLYIYSPGNNSNRIETAAGKYSAMFFAVGPSGVLGTFGANGTAGSLLETGSKPNSTIVAADGAHAIQFASADSVKMTVLTGGNVGIGTVDPIQALDVAGSIRSTTVSGQADGILLCVKSGRVGYCSGSVTNVSCTCN